MAGMTSLLSEHGSAPQPVVVRTFAEDQAVQRRRSGLRRTDRLVPAGIVHAAGHDTERALCGVLLDSLHEFGRSRYPFERFSQDTRCRTCDEAAGLRSA
jgi:hypothetical protein